MATKTGTTKRDILRGTSAADVLAGLAGNDDLFGLGGNDTLDGGAGNDLLDGGAGRDSMSGGAGNDTYIVSQSTDVVSEAKGLGTDLVKARASFTLSANVEKLTLTGSAGYRGTGNAQANVIIGNAGNNLLRGLAGSDTLDGKGGKDTLDGGTGADIMKGGAGNDTFIVDNVKDKVSDTSGIDTVRSSVNFTLPSTIEKLILTGSKAINGTGNARANTITGNSGNNILDGKDGLDTLIGGAGNDTYVLRDEFDKVVDSGGIDTITSTVSRSLADYTGIENLTLVGLSAIDGVGDDFANTITGNAAANKLSGAGGDDVLNGGAGDDTLEGGAGADTLNGGSGSNTASYAGSASAVTVSLATGVATGGDAQGDTFSNIQNLTGSGFGDTLTGNNNANTIFGGLGNDIIDGLGGNDILDGGGGADTFNITGNDIALGLSSGFDTIQNFEKIAGLGNGDIVRIKNVAGGAWNPTEVGGNTVFSLTVGANPDPVAAITVVGITGMLAADDYVFFS